jgi:sortase A
VRKNLATMVRNSGARISGRQNQLSLRVRARRCLSALAAATCATRRSCCRRGSLWLERTCWTAGTLLLVSCLAAYGRMATYQRIQLAQFSAQPQSREAGNNVVLPGSVLGKLVIPRLGLSAIVNEGDDEPILMRAVGHIPGTAFPGYAGTVALAGHRDTFFRALKDMRDGDAIVFESGQVAHRYRVVRTQIVAPDDVAILKPAAEPALVLITCYPFTYIGHAPKRFAVTARLVSS